MTKNIIKLFFDNIILIIIIIIILIINIVLINYHMNIITENFIGIWENIDLYITLLLLIVIYLNLRIKYNLINTLNENEKTLLKINKMTSSMDLKPIANITKWKEKIWNTFNILLNLNILKKIIIIFTIVYTLLLVVIIIYLYKHYKDLYAIKMIEEFLKTKEALWLFYYDHSEVCEEILITDEIYGKNLIRDIYHFLDRWDIHTHTIYIILIIINCIRNYKYYYITRL